MTPERKAQLDQVREQREAAQARLDKINKEVSEFEKKMKEANAGNSARGWDKADLDELKQKQTQAKADLDRARKIEDRINKLPNS